MDIFSRKDSKSSNRCDSQPEDKMPDVGFTFSNLPQDLCTTQLARFVRQKTLPRAIRIKKNFAVKGSPIVLENGECLLLCFGVKLDRVHASLSKKNEYRLPLNAIQLYERLPLGKFAVTEIMMIIMTTKRITITMMIIMIIFRRG